MIVKDNRNQDQSMNSAPTSTLSVSTKRGVITFETNLEWEGAVAILGMMPAPSEFVTSLLEKAYSGKYMSASQVSWVYKIAEDELAKKREESAPKVTKKAVQADVSNVLGALTQAKINGLKKPALRLLTPTDALSVTIKYMSSGKNIGGCWVTVGDDAQLMGKINDQGDFTPYDNSHLGKSEASEFMSDLNDNLDARVIEFGRNTGSCACCGRELTRTDSIERGIGPICAEKFGVM